MSETELPEDPNPGDLVLVIEDAEFEENGDGTRTLTGGDLKRVELNIGEDYDE